MSELRPPKIYLNRTGNFSLNSRINQDLMQDFVKTSDLRYDVFIKDSGKLPEPEAINVGMDVLAWRSRLTFSEITKQTMSQTDFSDLEFVDRQFYIKIHDRLITDAVQKAETKSRLEFEQLFLQKLNLEVTKNLSSILYQEKLAPRVQYLHWLSSATFLTNSLILAQHNNFEVVGIQLGFYLFVANPGLNLIGSTARKKYQELQTMADFSGVNFRVPVPPFNVMRDWKMSWLPTLPLDSWIKGQLWLRKNGHKLIEFKLPEQGMNL